MFEEAATEEIVAALSGEYGPRAEAAAVLEAVDGEFGEELQERVLMAAATGHHGEGFQGQAIAIAKEFGYFEQWEQVAQEERDADPEYQQQVHEAEVHEAGERMMALLDSERARLERRFGPLSEREQRAMIDAIPEGAFDGDEFPDMVEKFGPRLKEMRDGLSLRGAEGEENRIEAGVERANELLKEREADQAGAAGRTRIEQRLYGDDPVPEPGSEEDRIERGVLAGWATGASDPELDEADAEIAALDGPYGDDDAETVIDPEG